MTYPPNAAPPGTGQPNDGQGWDSQGGPAVSDEQPYQPEAGKLSGLAVASLIFGLTGCLSLFGIILGISALRQIKQTGERGRGLAITGIVLGAVVNGGAAIAILISFVVSS